MKSFSFNQLQLQILLLIFILFSGMTLSFRFFIEYPQSERSMIAFQNKELSLIRLAIKESIRNLQSITYDYAVWDDTYNFVIRQNPEYIKVNFVDDTFISLAIDGILIINQQGKTVFSKGFLHHIREQFTLYSAGVHRLPGFTISEPISSIGEPQKTYGIVLTPAGLTLYSAVDIRRSDKSGKPNGKLIFFRQFNQTFIDTIANTVMTPITFELLADKGAVSPKSINWLSDVHKDWISKFSYLHLADVLGQTAAQLKVEHQQYKLPSLIDRKVLGFILIFSLVIFFAYLLVNKLVIAPMQRFLKQITALKIKDDEAELSTNFRIQELNEVAKHFNHLRHLVNEQRFLLNEQLTIDYLTGLNNRRGFEEQLARHCDLMTRQNVSFSIVLIEIDFFDQYRSILGLVDGDQLLVQIADILKSHIKRKNDSCAHFKREEFVILYSGIDQVQLTQILESIIDHVNRLKIPHPNSSVSPHVTLSIGACYIASSQGAYDYISVKNLLRAADFALHQSREKGRSCHTCLSFETYTEIVKVSHE